MTQNRLRSNITRISRHQFGWKALGAIYGQTGRISDSLVPNQKSVQFAAMDAEAHCNLGVTLKELGKLDQAEACFMQAIALKPDFAQAHSYLGKVLYALGHKNSALSSIERANLLDPKSKDISLLLSVIKARKARINSKERGQGITLSGSVTTPPSKILCSTGWLSQNLRLIFTAQN